MDDKDFRVMTCLIWVMAGMWTAFFVFKAVVDVMILTGRIGP